MILLLSIGLLLTLILWVRINAFISLIITALFAGLANGMPAQELLKSIQNGIGGTLGGLVLVLALGVILGSILSETGAAQVISTRILRLFGPKQVHWALACTGFIIGIAMFYNAGFVVLAPLVFSVARTSGQNLVSLAIAMAAPLSVTHGFLPPHPGATNVANLFGANLGKTLLYGFVVAVPAVLVAGIYFPKYILKNMASKPPAGLFEPKVLPQEALPSAFKSIGIALLPVLLMAIATTLEFFLEQDSNLLQYAKFFGDPGVALLLAVLSALFWFGKHPFLSSNNEFKPSALLEKSNVALGAVSTLPLVIAAGGAFKQVLVDSGLGKTLAIQLMSMPISPLFLGWGIATLLRIALGSATVAGTTAAGLLVPMVNAGVVSPELMTLAVGAGSLMCSHVNDTGFWMFQEWFGLSLRDTFKSWTVMETIVGTIGLFGVLLLNTFI